MNTILLQVQAFLEKANREAVEIPPGVADELAEAVKNAFLRQFTEAPREGFTLRMSNVGRPLCQLQHEQAGSPAESLPYTHKMRMLYGDITEALAVAVMKSAGIHIQEFQGKVSLPVAGTKLNGTYDVKINNKIWDVKSASPYAFSHKFSPERGGFDAINADDGFGYVAQGFGYSAAAGTEFGGWIAVDKSTGEWNVVEVPEHVIDEHKRNALLTIAKNVKAMQAPPDQIERCFTDEPEVYYRKETGNRILGKTCEFCPFKRSCWPEAKQMRQVVSKGQNPPIKWYTYLAPEYENADTEREDSDG